jgi:hypothetical protein
MIKDLKMSNYYNINDCNNCEFYKKQIRDKFQKNCDKRKKIEYLKKELQDLKKQRLIVPINKGYDNYKETKQKEIINEIHNNLSETINNYCMGFGIKPQLLTLKSEKNTHFIDFENNTNRRNVGSIDFNKFTSLESMNTNMKNDLRKTLCEIERNNISQNATTALTVNKVNTFSRHQLESLKKELNKNIPIFNITDDINRISGTYLQIDFAFEMAIKILMRRKDKRAEELSQPLIFKLSIDGTNMNNNFNYVTYLLSAFECNDDQYANTDSQVLIALLAGDENYDVIKHYFKEFHEKIEHKIEKRSLKVNDFTLCFNFILCSDLKSLLTFSGINHVSGKYCCLYCRTAKHDFSNAKSFIEENKARSHLNGGLGRQLQDWNDIKRGQFGIKNDMIMKIEPQNYIIDTLHLRIRITEKFFSSLLSSIIEKTRIKNLVIIEDLNFELNVSKINAKINLEVLSDVYIKYKLQANNLEMKIKSLDCIIAYIRRKYNTVEGIANVYSIWKVFKK